ncbi:hypothetical protein C8R45DRAFT_1223253 [Mycena sanguinolenta]|nr:hypothetical protein C8R45DRAFT_1223253 [Mycena sanguinolenta]
MTFKHLTARVLKLFYSSFVPFCLEIPVQANCCQHFHSIENLFPLSRLFPACLSPFSPSFLQVSMQIRTFNARAVYQNTPASSCRELAGICITDAIALIFIIVFVGGLLFLTLVRNFSASGRRREDHAESDHTPPPYSGIGFPPSSSPDLALCKESPSPSLDPYHLVALSFDNSLLLKDQYFSHVPYPHPSLASSQQGPSGLGLSMPSGVAPAGSHPLSSSSPLTSPPPAYVREPRRDTAVDRSL